MKKITILMLHLLHGGIEKQTITLANELCDKYNVEIISTYSMKSEPAYPVDERIKIKYLIDDKPNRDEFKSCVSRKDIIGIFREGFKAFSILQKKKKLMIKEIKALDCDYVLSTRIEYAEMLSNHAPDGVVTVTQEHLHDDSPEYIERVKRSFRNLDYLVVLCEGSEKNHGEWLKDNKKIKLVRIPNILEDIPEDTAKLCGNNIVSVGRLHPVKDFPTLIKVFSKVQKRVPDSTLTIVGGGDEHDNLSRLAESLGVSHKVKITGMVSKEEVQKYMLSSDIYVMTSLTECFPMVLLEASSVGLPLVSFDVPVGPCAIIENGKNGYLIEDKKIDEMADKVVEMLADREKLCEMGKNAKIMAESYLPENIMPLWYDLFR